MTKLTEDTIVYVGSLWHRDCDPFCTIVADTPEYCQKILDDDAAVEWQEMRGDSEPLEDEVADSEPEDDIMTGGVFAERLGTLELTEEELAELKQTHSVYLPR